MDIYGCMRGMIFQTENRTNEGNEAEYSRMGIGKMK
jgi:hypothetical protein